MTKRISAIVLGLAICIGISAYPAYAANTKGKIAEAKSLVKKIKRDQRKLQRLLNSAAVMTAVNAATVSDDLQDSDDDGLPDIFEHARGSDACNHDSDDDGIDDGDEANGGSSPNDPGEGEVEVTGAISAIDATTVTVDGHTCTADSSTDFGGETGLSSYEVNDVVEIHCALQSSVLILTRIQSENESHHGGGHH